MCCAVLVLHCTLLYYTVREPSSFWRENALAVVIPLRLLAKMAGTIYQTLDVLSFCDQERAQPLSIEITLLTFLLKM